MIPENLQHLDATTIAARHTITLNPRKALAQMVSECASERGVQPGSLAAKLVVDALELFDDEIATRSPARVLAEWAALANAHEGPREPLLYVAQRSDVTRVRLRAGEFVTETSDFAELLLAKGVERYLNAGN